MAIHLITNHSKEVDWRIKPHVGTQATIGDRLYGDKRCLICGNWITWRDVEPEYCFEPMVVRKIGNRGVGGTSLCMDYFERMSESEHIKTDNRVAGYYLILKGRGVVG